MLKSKRTSHIDGAILKFEPYEYHAFLRLFLYHLVFFYYQFLVYRRALFGHKFILFMLIKYTIIDENNSEKCRLT